MTDFGRCRACGATVIWSKTTNGAQVPLNPQPVSVAIKLSGDSDAPVAIQSHLQVHMNTCSGKLASFRTRN